MRNLFAVLLSTLAACQGAADTTGRGQAEVIGGDNLIGLAYESVCAMFVQLPPDDDDNPQDPIWCAGTHIADGILLTSATCVEQNVTAGTIDDIEVRCGQNADEILGVNEVVMHRYYAPETPTVDDLALLVLDGTPTSPLAVLNEAPLTTLGPSDPADCDESNGGIAVDGCAALVGYGETVEGLEDFGSRRGTNVPVRRIAPRSLVAGTPDQTGCAGDTGAPLFMDLGDGPVLVAVSSGVGTCTQNTVRTRVDFYLDEFIHPYLDRFGTTCGLDTTCETTGCPRTPDPDCDPCAWNDTCEEDCPTRDWDCELGSFVGAACIASGQCERGGRCVAAHDDAAFLYCNQPCDPAETGACPAGMLCSDGGQGNECAWDPALPSPGSQGASCGTGLDCRSGICEETYCVNECDPGAADPCPANLADPDQPYTCLPSSVQPGTNVCIGEILSGGGGFCSTGGRIPSWPSFLLVGLALLVIRRRR